MIRDQGGRDEFVTRASAVVHGVAIPKEDRVACDDVVGGDLIAETRKLGTGRLPVPHGTAELR